MKRCRLTDLTADGTHVLAAMLPGRCLTRGGLSFKAPGQRSHTSDGPGGSDRHVHDDCEAFVILQGRAVMEVDGRSYNLAAGDVVIIEPGEDHHLLADSEDPCVNLWLHAGDKPHWT
ncbi:MAG: cupin domain-containing protein [Planctomycetes bacterium]|nr:cupin domain-containing protein [Planctomycetota bacterium]